MRRASVSVAIFACLLAMTACADSTAPSASRNVKPAPSGVSNTRYILASGDTPPPGCTDVGDGYWLCGEDGTNGTVQTNQATLSNQSTNAR